MVEACPLCGKSEFAQRFYSADKHHNTSIMSRVVECKGCTLVFLNPMPSEQQSKALYPESYLPHQAYKSAPNRLKMLLSKLSLPNPNYEPQFSRPGRVLDIGCGSGGFLSQAKSRGWETFGVELNPSAAASGQNAGLDIFAGSLREAAFKDHFFDYIRLSHSLEHMVNPNETLAGIRRIIKREGKLFISVPNIAGLAPRVFGEYWWNLALPVHIFHYSPKTLSLLLENNGFDVIKVAFNSSYPGIFTSLQLVRNRATRSLANDGKILPITKIFGHWLAKATDVIRMGDIVEVNAKPRDD